MGELPVGDWVVDCTRSRVGFSLKHMLMSTVKGSFHDFAGTLSVSDGAAQAQGSVEVASLDTGERVRDEHVLSSADFFDLATHPQIGFRSTSVELDRKRLKVIGPLSIRGNSNEIQLEGQIERVAPEPGDARGDLAARRDRAQRLRPGLESGARHGRPAARQQGQDRPRDRRGQRDRERRLSAAERGSVFGQSSGVSAADTAKTICRRASVR